MNFVFQVGNQKISAMSRGEAELMNKCQRALDDGTYKEPLDKLRLLCLARGTHGIVGLGRLFRRMDHEGTETLSLEKFMQGLHDGGIDCSVEEAEEIFRR